MTKVTISGLWSMILCPSANWITASQPKSQPPTSLQVLQCGHQHGTATLHHSKWHFKSREFSKKFSPERNYPRIQDIPGTLRTLEVTTLRSLGNIINFTFYASRDTISETRFLITICATCYACNIRIQYSGLNLLLLVNNEWQKNSTYINNKKWKKWKLESEKFGKIDLNQGWWIFAHMNKLDIQHNWGTPPGKNF